LCPVSLRTPLSSRSPDHDPHRTIYYLGHPLGRLAGLKHRQLARQVGMIITTGRIRRTLIIKINLLDDADSHMDNYSTTSNSQAQRNSTRNQLRVTRSSLHPKRRSTCHCQHHDRDDDFESKSGQESIFLFKSKTEQYSISSSSRINIAAKTSPSTPSAPRAKQDRLILRTLPSTR
jgi:hypothetical protein